jgi:hypothetical protein
MHAICGSLGSNIFCSVPTFDRSIKGPALRLLSPFKPGRAALRSYALPQRSDCASATAMKACAHSRVRLRKRLMHAAVPLSDFLATKYSVCWRENSRVQCHSGHDLWGEGLVSQTSANAAPSTHVMAPLRIQTKSAPAIRCASHNLRSKPGDCLPTLDARFDTSHTIHFPAITHFRFCVLISMQSALQHSCAMQPAVALLLEW